MLDDHCERADALVDLDVGLDHTGVLQRKSIVDIHVTGQLELWIPHLYDRNLCRCNANHLAHTV